MTALASPQRTRARSLMWCSCLLQTRHCSQIQKLLRHMVALANLCERASELGIEIIDCQNATPHLLRIGAQEISRSEFLRRIKEGMRRHAVQGQWRARNGRV
mmetsp:Transcript_61532/g.170624  ORF Transcript_61532/g.170624 Transcript_61532/m.170624 type:complete len:102 (+) Transcript_61532:234-539(+)